MAVSIEEALPLLRRPFAPAAVRAKVQTQERGPAPGWGQVVRYIDARLVAERLNLVAGGAWTYQLEPLDPALRPSGPSGPLYVVCRLSVLGQTHADVGEGRDPKAAFSDALKRAAVPFGIGRSVYAVPRRFMRAAETPGARDVLKRRGDRLYLTEANAQLLQDEYTAWLGQVGTAAFGETLEHGPDTAGGDAPPDEAPQDSPPAAQPVRRGGLRAVPATRPTAPPASVRDREPLEQAITRAGLKRGTVGELARLLLGEGLLDRLDRDQVAELAALLHTAHAHGIGQDALARAVAAAGEQRRDPARAAATLRAWLVQPAPRQGQGQGGRS
jgi:hypothetical protein